MSSFYCLPSELLRMICKLSEASEASTLSSLSQTCRKIHAITNPILFNTVSFSRDAITRDFPPRLLDALQGLSESPRLCTHIVSFNLLGTFPFSHVTTQYVDAILRHAPNLKSLSFQLQDHVRSPLPAVLCASNPPFSLERFTWSAPISDARFITEFLPTQRDLLHLALLWPLNALPALPPESLTKLRVLEVASSSLASFSAQSKTVRYFKLVHASGVVALREPLPSVRVLSIGRLRKRGTLDILPQLPNVAYLQTMASDACMHICPAISSLISSPRIQSQLADESLLCLVHTRIPLRCIRCTDLPEPEYVPCMGGIIARLFACIPTLEWVEQRFAPAYNEHTCLRWYRDRASPALVQWDDWQHAWLDDWHEGGAVLLDAVPMSVGQLYGPLTPPPLQEIYKLLREHARKPRIFRRRYDVR
ncbi:hypothetical protein PC9H_001750 [Pleurotus ostreatus]|uniref:F-box domain-containing protein n=1 Tax=Pleurotus ostreatus TaxID=5322 RepID=A0A8H7A3G5_PLEOS|nr:uncharacterized protein PC9H_001750 [Pleurotus ostreatus]KAF7441400.1 hypothetical protein PC9H_001750 [Pleurotus ostreatus]